MAVRGAAAASFSKASLRLRTSAPAPPSGLRSRSEDALRGGERSVLLHTEAITEMVGSRRPWPRLDADLRVGPPEQLADLGVRAPVRLQQQRPHLVGLAALQRLRSPSDALEPGDSSPGSARSGETCSSRSTASPPTSRARPARIRIASCLTTVRTQFDVHDAGTAILSRVGNREAWTLATTSAQESPHTLEARDVRRSSSSSSRDGDGARVRRRAPPVLTAIGPRRGLRSRWRALKAPSKGWRGLATARLRVAVWIAQSAVSSGPPWSGPSKRVRALARSSSSRCQSCNPQVQRIRIASCWASSVRAST
jgi:hypothetical protein